MRLTNCNALLDCFPDLRVYFTVSPKPPHAHMCVDCSTVWSNKTSLLYHVISRHLSLKPFACDACERTASVYTVVQQHYAKAHAHLSDKPSQMRLSAKPQSALKCSACGETFPAALHLLFHFFEQHWYEIQLAREEAAASAAVGAVDEPANEEAALPLEREEQKRQRLQQTCDHE
mmetsp:Transcript_13106/g.35298  ORF Transcript_13106/g.35298 Transcript_13106/m.35298 type:complete len:175 (+) Transcript_13106:83-607(+)